MTKHGETDGFGAEDFVRVLEQYLRYRADRDYPLVNSGELRADPLEHSVRRPVRRFAWATRLQDWSPGIKIVERDFSRATPTQRSATIRASWRAHHRGLRERPDGVEVMLPEKKIPRPPEDWLGRPSFSGLENWSAACTNCAAALLGTLPSLPQARIVAADLGVPAAQRARAALGPPEAIDVVSRPWWCPPQSLMIFSRSSPSGHFSPCSERRPRPSLVSTIIGEQAFVEIVDPFIYPRRPRHPRFH